MPEVSDEELDAIMRAFRRKNSPPFPCLIFIFIVFGLCMLLSFPPTHNFLLDLIRPFVQ